MRFKYRKYNARCHNHRLSVLSNMATSDTLETPEVMVTDQLIPMQEFDRVRNAVCLLRPSTSDPSKSWSATGFYANMKMKKENKLCIITNYHVFCQKQHDDHMVAVFHHESTEKESSEIPLVPFNLIAHSKEEELDYVLIGIDERKMQSIGVKPILADINQQPIVKKHDKVFIIQHPKGMKKHFSQDTVKHVNKPFLEYNADTLEGSSGSPVFVLKKSTFFLVALHSKGVQSYPGNWNKGVLFSEILNHFRKGKVTKPNFLPTGVPDQMESDVNIVGASGTEHLIKERQKRWKDEKIRYAIIGGSGTGKSAFVNAIRGLANYDKEAAPVGVTETTTERTEYNHPDNPKISFVDLPGIGSSINPDLETYCKNIGLEDYDIFLLFNCFRFTHHDLVLAKKVKSIGKSFLFIHTKIDIDCHEMKQRGPFNEEELMQKLKDTLKENLRDLISSEKDIFLINNYEKERWDFPRLVAAIKGVFPVAEREWLKYSSSNVTRDYSKRMDGSAREETNTQDADDNEQADNPEQVGETTDLTEEYLADARAYIQENGVSGIREFLREKIDGWKKVKIRLGITGDAGAGKSAFINAIRGLHDGDRIKRAAKVGVTESTLEPMEYEHPDNKMISLVDLPGIGTPRFSDLRTYCKKVDLESYDMFLIFTTSRFTKNDLELAKKVKSLRKSFFLIRTKIDVDLMPKKGKDTIKEEKVLQEIRNDCMDNLKDLISSDKEIFLIANYDKDKWDFDRLVKAIGNALPVLQKEVLMLSLSNLTRGCIRRKARILKARAVAVAAVSAGKGAIPLPKSRADLDAVLIKDTITDYYRRLGLHDITPDNFEHFNEFQEVFQRYNFQSDEELVLPLESEAHGARKVQDYSKYVPIVGTAIAGSISFVLTLRYLNRCVNELEEVALAVWDEAAKGSTQNSERQSEMN